MSKTVLAHIVPRLTNQNENAATEALAFVLNRSKAARSALDGVLRAAGADLPAIARVETQRSEADEESRPDVTLLDSAGRLVGFVEVKYWAGLTDAQPVEYLRRLGERGGKILLVVAPERRLTPLWSELVVRCRLDTIPVEPVRTDTSHAITVGERRSMILVSWGALLAALEGATERAEDRDALADLRQLRGLSEFLDAEGYSPISRAEIDDLDVPRRIQRYTTLADEIVAKGVADGLLNTKGLKAGAGAAWYGRYVRLGRRVGVWIGLHHGLWARFGRSPLWLRFQGEWGNGHLMREVLGSWLAAVPPRLYETEHDGGVAAPITLRPGVEKEVIIRDSLDMLREVEQIVEKAGVPILGEAPSPSDDGE